MKLFDEKSSNFVIVYGDSVDSIMLPYIKHFTKLMKHNFNLYMPCFCEYAIDENDNVLNKLGLQITDGELKSNYPIIINCTKSKVCKELLSSLDDNSYAIKFVDKKIYIAYTSNFAGLYALDRFEKEYFIKDTPELPSDYLIKETKNIDDVMVTVPMDKIRDPYVVMVDGVHYMYGTEWQLWKNYSKSIKDNTWEGPIEMVKAPSDVAKFRWAPEVYYYNGSYYMFTAYHSALNDKRAVHTFRSKLPEGPFEEISNGPLTPKDLDCIDGNLYVDKNSQPWIFFVHEWTCTDDGIGRMDVAKLSKDLTHIEGDIIELFRADDFPYCVSIVTDGPELLTNNEGELLMLWASSDEAGYFEAVLKSKSGTPLGPWEHQYELYSKKLSGTLDGGHGMIFEDNDGQKYFTFHSPNHKVNDIYETPRFLPIRESAGMFIWDLYKD